MKTMNEIKITLGDIYNLTCTLLNNNVSKDVWISAEVMTIFIPVLEEAMKQGMKCSLNEPMSTYKGRVIMVAGFTFIENQEINGVMCFGNSNFILNERDAPLEYFLPIKKD